MYICTILRKYQNATVATVLGILQSIHHVKAVHLLYNIEVHY